MRLNITAAVVAVGLCLLVAGVASAQTATCQMTGWSAWTSFTGWSVCKDSVQTRREHRVRAIVRRPAGATCPSTYETRVVTQSCGVVLTPVNCVVSDWGAWSGGDWSECSGGQQSRTETHARTVTTQPANGGTACPALTETRTASQACTSVAGSASLSWTPPTRNTDSSALTNLAGYRVVYGRSSSELTQTIQIASPTAVAYTVTGLASGTWYFAVKAYTSGAESDPSNIAQKVVL